MNNLTRATLWINKIPGTSTSGTGRSDSCFSVTAGLIQGFLLSNQDTLNLLLSWNSKCNPQWTEKELLHKIEDVHKHTPSKGYGWKLKDSKTYQSSTSYSPSKTKQIATWSPKLSKEEQVSLHGAELLSSLNDNLTIQDLMNSSPIELPESPSQNFQAYLNACWKDTYDSIWMGNIYDSSKPEHSVFFKSPSSWKLTGQPHKKALWTSGCTFKENSFNRSKDSILEHRYNIVESDKLPYGKQIAIFKFLKDELKLTIPMAVDTKGVSIHFWVDRRDLSQTFLSNLTLLLVGQHNGQDKFQNPDGSFQVKRKFKGGMGCDPATFRGSQPARLPGQFRPFNPETPLKPGGTQTIVYLS